MASDSALFVGWKLPVVGREADALELFGSFVGFLTKQETAGTIDSFEPCLLSPHGGDLDGFILGRGERSKLSALRLQVPDQRWRVRGGGRIRRRLRRQAAAALREEHPSLSSRGSSVPG